MIILLELEIELIKNDLRSGKLTPEECEAAQDFLDNLLNQLDDELNY